MVGVAGLAGDRYVDGFFGLFVGALSDRIRYGLVFTVESNYHDDQFLVYFPIVAIHPVQSVGICLQFDGFSSRRTLDTTKNLLLPLNYSRNRHIVSPTNHAY